MGIDTITVLPKTTVDEIAKSIEKYRNQTKTICFKDSKRNNMFDCNFVKADDVEVLLQHIENLLEVREKQVNKKAI